DLAREHAAADVARAVLAAVRAEPAGDRIDVDAVGAQNLLGHGASPHLARSAGAHRRRPNAMVPDARTKSKPLRAFSAQYVPTPPHAPRARSNARPAPRSAPSRGSPLATASEQSAVADARGDHLSRRAAGQRGARLANSRRHQGRENATEVAGAGTEVAGRPPTHERPVVCLGRHVAGSDRCLAGPGARRARPT